MKDCIFCKIIRKEAPSEVVYQDAEMIAFKDIYPKAPVHLLVVAKEHLRSLETVTEEQGPLLAHMLLKLPTLAKAQGLVDGFRTIINTGVGGGQEIDHIHFHLLGGGKLPAR